MVKIEIVVKWPHGDATLPVFALLMLLQIVCTIVLYASGTRGSPVVGLLVIVLALAGAAGCFWKHEDLAYLSADHAQRGTFLLLLTLLGLSHTAGEFELALYGVVYVVNALYIVSSFALAATTRLRSEQ